MKEASLALACLISFLFFVSTNAISIPKNITKITIGMSTIVTTKDPALQLLGGSALNATDLLMHKLKETQNGKIKILGQEYEIGFKIFDSLGSNPIDNANHQLMCNDPDIFVVLGSTSADQCYSAAQVIEKCGKL